jgi:alkylation response protein AidB-like acyl-CoA dehydrogenase
MDLSFSSEDDAFRAEARAWLADNVPRNRLPSVDTREGFDLHVVWEQQLFDAGWSVVSWPKELGGREASLVQWLIFEEEYWAACAPRRVTQNGIFLLAPAIFEFGTEEQKQRILRPMARAEVAYAQAWSEPNAGSDLASVKSTARRVEGGWRLTGQKTWCTRGAFADYVYGLFRTSEADKPHRGLTYFLIDVNQPGVTVRGVNKLDGTEGFAEVFLDDAFVPDADVLGDVDKGWYVAMTTTSSERGLSLRSPGRFLANTSRLLDQYRATPRPAARDAVIEAWVDAQAYRWYTWDAATQMADGKQLGASSSLMKLFWSEHDIRCHETAMRLRGEGAWDHDNPWLDGFLFSLAGPIYAGTNEIQRNVVAQRLLGLPRGKR